MIAHHSSSRPLGVRGWWLGGGVGVIDLLFVDFVQAWVGVRSHRRLVVEAHVFRFGDMERAFSGDSCCCNWFFIS
jgi:hypothetical protein